MTQWSLEWLLICVILMPCTVSTGFGASLPTDNDFKICHFFCIYGSLDTLGWWTMNLMFNGRWSLLCVNDSPLHLVLKLRNELSNLHHMALDASTSVGFICGGLSSRLSLMGVMCLAGGLSSTIRCHCYAWLTVS